MRLLILASLVLAAFALPSHAAASEPLWDANVKFLSLKVNPKGEALISYRLKGGKRRNVLVWGAINARPPTEGVPQVRFRFDYAGGWGKYRNGRYWKRFRDRCRPYDGPRLALLVAACKAPDGSYWAVQAWKRRLPLLGFDPWHPAQRNVELHVSHWTGPLARLELHPNWTYDGQWQGVFGRYSYRGVPVYGFAATPKGVPQDKYGRNLYIDTLNSAYGKGWKRESGILTHRRTGTFCHSFVPQHGYPHYPSQALRPAAHGERHRVTIGGPGVTPIVRVGIPGLKRRDRRRDAQFNAVFDRVMAGDSVCTHER
jgi:hypothetical protein